MENTLLRYILVYLYQDHLHIRGEYAILAGKATFKVGSSPHTWRILITIDYLILQNRIISTYVENTGDKGVMYYAHEDHLHIRGEYF